MAAHFHMDFIATLDGIEKSGYSNIKSIKRRIGRREIIFPHIRV